MVVVEQQIEEFKKRTLKNHYAGNDAEAEKWFQKAAELGNWVAKDTLRTHPLKIAWTCKARSLQIYAILREIESLKSQFRFLIFHIVRV